jgi:hypothetical protein
LNFLKYDLGNLKRGEIVEVTLTSGANVRLMDSSNFNNYKNGRKHKYYGGLAKRSPLNRLLKYPPAGAPLPAVRS